MIYAAVSGSVMVAIIVVLRLLFLRRLPKQCFRILWILAALRFLLPFSFTFEVDMPQGAFDAPLVNTSQTVVIDASSAASANDTAEWHLSAADIVRIILPFGTLVSGGFMSSAYIRMHRVAKGGERIRRDRWKSIDIRVGQGADTPFSCGVFHPIIFIPSHLLTLEDSRLDDIISHEQKHIKSGDQLVKWLITAAVCLNWYNPLAWVMWCMSSRDIELACDEAVLRSGKSRFEYALTLIGAAETRCGGTVCSFGAPLLNERIECIMKSRKLTACGFACAALVLASMSVFFVQVTAAKTEDDMPCDANISESVCDAVDTALDGADEQEDSESIVLVCPLAEHGAITGHFGENTNPIGVTTFNNGVNVAAKQGDDVYAAASGIVSKAEYDFEDGNYIVIEHMGGCEIYRHLDEILVAVGDEVESGEVIATVGSTGCATGPNLGFSVMVDGAYVSPESLFE